MTYKLILIFTILLIIVSLVTLTAAIIHKTNEKTEVYSELLGSYVTLKPVIYERETINNFIETNPHYENFYDIYTENTNVSKTIIDYAIDHDIPIHIAFSLAWNESRYKITAIGPKNSNGTRDWGLFQLNDGYRESWTEEDFFNIDKNVSTGIEYLAYCIKETGNIEEGIGAYNKGVTGIKKYGLPEEYISNILVYEKKLDEELNEYLYN